MPGKSVPISVRLTPEDATFLASIKISGAATPSDKMRALIDEARRRRDGGHNYSEALSFFEELLTETTHKLREAESSIGLHSELLVQLVGWLPDILAYLIVRTSEVEEDDTEARLRRLENGLADRLFALMEQVLRLGVTRRNPCYDHEAVSSRVAPIVELSNLLRMKLSESEA